MISMGRNSKLLKIIKSPFLIIHIPTDHIFDFKRLEHLHVVNFKELLESFSECFKLVFYWVT